MNIAHNEQSGAAGRRSFDRSLLVLLSGAAVLILAGLIVIPLVAGRAPVLAPADTPHGAVQRFYQAAYRGDYPAAYGFLSAETQGKLSLSQLQQAMSTDLRNSQIRTVETTINGGSATVQVTQTHFQSGGLFGSNEWNQEREVLLAREGAAWRIVSGPFYIPEAH